MDYSTAATPPRPAMENSRSSVPRRRRISNNELPLVHFDSYADLLETHGMTSLLFETPTGFAVFNFYAIGLYVPNAIEGINCLHNELVMEVMWGMKHLLHKLVPGEKSQLSMEDRLPMSQGLQILLRRYGFDVEPEMVNEQIVATARVLFKCDDVEKKEYQNLCLIRHYLKKCISCITRTRVMGYIVGMIRMFPEDVISKLLSDANKYDAKINKVACLRTYSQVASAHRVRAFKRNELDRLVKKAKKVYQAELVEDICL
ncbi:unnamed protein product [Miscanthus lutarioriparius]|uniref:Uncharacterized protein n=1 Tax=Miscanthus lutarioriparius TaxID=422564 RepID=A0A811P2M9_9POAL|nr:unnamed protein product [Miscanthus lutarioriparius]